MKNFFKFFVLTISLNLFLPTLSWGRLPQILKGRMDLDKFVWTIIQSNPNEASPDNKRGEYICRNAGGGSECNGVSIGEGICRAGNGTGCTGVGFGEGVCRAGGSAGCAGVGLGEGVCRAVGAAGCSGVSLAEGICRASSGAVDCNPKMSLAEAICKANDGVNCANASY